MKKKYNNFIIILLFILGILGLIATLIYIFHSSTAILTSDSVITDVLSHQQRLKNTLFLKTWYYGNEFWLFSLSIPTYLLSFFIKNNVILRQISVLITAILFFFLIIKYCKKSFNFKQTIIICIIFLSGISYSVLDYFYAFNAYLTVIINSLFLIYLFYKVILDTNTNKIFSVLLLIFSLLFNIGSLRYFPSVIIPLIMAFITILFLENKTKNTEMIIKENKKKLIFIIYIITFSLIGLGIFYLLTNIYHYEQRAGNMTLGVLSGKIVINKISAIIDCINNFFGYDNRNNPAAFMTGMQYFVPNHRIYKIFSVMSFTMLIKIIMCLLVIVISPIILFKNYKSNNKFINFLLIFNTYSWIVMIMLYILTCNFFYNYSELKYFLLNIVLNLIMCIYSLYNYVVSKRIKFYIVDIFILLYIASNLYTTYNIISVNNTEAINKKYELVKVLKENNLYYGYGCFWSGLLMHFLSNYDVTIAALEFRDSGLYKYKWYSDETWYNKKNNGTVFLIMDKLDKKRFSYYKDKKYYKPDKIIKCNDFLIYVYNKNPFLNLK